MSEKEIDWEKIFDNPDDPKPEIEKETLWVQLERMRQAQKTLPRWYITRQVLSLLYICLYAGLIYLIFVTRIPYGGVSIMLICLQIIVNIDYFMLVYKLNKRARGL